MGAEVGVCVCVLWLIAESQSKHDVDHTSPGFFGPPLSIAAADTSTPMFTRDPHPYHISASTTHSDRYIAGLATTCTTLSLRVLLPHAHCMVLEDVLPTRPKAYTPP